ncbi:MAG: hypothetical protein K6C69_03510 [Lachnospiraceae bacterium]|nr:hypothetical protein [Lachnospiraceae bacterium]
MIIVKVVLAALFLIAVPMIIGNSLSRRMHEGYEGNLIANWVFGIVAMFAQLQLLTVPMIIAKVEFHVLFDLYLAILLFETAAGLARHGGEFAQMLQQVPKRFRAIGILGIIVLVSILLQGYVLGYYQHVDNDDARYVPYALAAVQKDALMNENPITGQPIYWELSESLKDMVSPWIMLWAILAKVAMFHPTIYIHTVLPFFLIPLSYAVYWLISMELFSEKEVEKRVLFTGIVSAINIFSGYSSYNAGAFLLFRIWQGKAVFVGILLPLLFLLMLRMWRIEKVKVFDYYEMLVTSLACCMTSGFGIVLTALLLGIFSIFHGFRRKNILGALGIWVALIPCVVYGYIYAFGGDLFR